MQGQHTTISSFAEIKIISTLRSNDSEIIFSFIKQQRDSNNICRQQSLHFFCLLRLLRITQHISEKERQQHVPYTINLDFFLL